MPESPDIVPDPDDLARLIEAREGELNALRRLHRAAVAYKEAQAACERHGQALRVAEPAPEEKAS